MKPMGNRLKQALLDAADGYSNDDFNRDYEDIRREIIDITDEVTEKEDMDKYENTNVSRLNEQFSVADEIIKFKQLLDAGVITQEEFDTKKSQLLSI